MDGQESDKVFLERCIRIARENMEKGNGGPFGALIVKEGKILAESGNMVLSGKDPTAHAEIMAIREAGRKLNDFSLAGCTLYSSCEPCPMCLSAIYWARIERVVFAGSRHDASEAGFDDNFQYGQVCLPWETRTLRGEQIRMPGAAEVFKEWSRMENKIRY